MKNTFTRLLAMLLVLVMVFGLVACSSPDTPDTSTPPGATNIPVETEGWEAVAAKIADVPTLITDDPEHQSWMDTTSPVTLSVYNVFGSAYYEDYSAWATDPVLQKVTELTGVTIDGQFPADLEGGNDLTLLLASGDPLPDMIANIGPAMQQYVDLVESDSLWDIAELIDTYCPEMWDMVDPYVWEANMDADGHLWYMPNYFRTPTSAPYTVSNGWWMVNTQVARDMGLDVTDEGDDTVTYAIKTLEDMEKVIEYYMANKDKYPQINKVFVSPHTYHVSIAGPIYAAYGGAAPYTIFGLDMIYDEKADYVNLWVEDEIGQKTLKYLNNMARKGWITEDLYTYGADDVSDGSALFLAGRDWGFANQAVEEGADTFYTAMPMVSAEGVKAVQTTTSYYAGRNDVTVITKDCKDPERAIKFLQFMVSEYGQSLSSFGLYGENWEYAVSEDGVPYPKVIEAQNPGNTDLLEFCVDTAYSSMLTYSNLLATGSTYKIEAAKDLVWDVVVTVPGPASANLDPSSETMVIGMNVVGILNKYVPEITLAKDDAEFERLYQEMLDTFAANNMEDLRDVMLQMTHEYIAAEEARGVVYNPWP